MWENIKYLQDPQLVARIQEYFGVRILKLASNSPRPRLVVNSKSKGKHVKREVCEDKARFTYGDTKSNDVPCNGVLDDNAVSSESEIESKSHVITNHWWYYLFVLGTALGDEIFYASFIPFWFWNVDGAVGRRVVFVWATIMYIGQGIKDIVRWPRPASPPVVRLQKKWALEYGMPSTHAMVGISIPFSVILYTMNRYQYSLPMGLLIAAVWCTVISISRLYLGMHTVLDIVVGLLLAVGLMIPLVPLSDFLDHILLTNQWSPAIMLFAAILLVLSYPASDRWTPTKTDTTMVLSVCVGIYLGAWTNYQLGNLTSSTKEPPYEIIWPTYSMVGLTLLRTALGFCCIIATRAMCKSVSYAVVCTLLKLDPEVLKKSNHSLENQWKSTVEITYTFITYLLLGFNTAYLLPNTFRLLGIERPTFYTEI